MKYYQTKKTYSLTLFKELHKLTYRDLAKITGVSYATLCQLENQDGYIATPEMAEKIFKGILKFRKNGYKLSK